MRGSWVTGLVLAGVLATSSAWAQRPGRPLVRPGVGAPAQVAEETEMDRFNDINRAQTVLTGTVKSKRILAMTRSIPPITMLAVEISDATALRGQVPDDLNFHLSTSTPGLIPAPGKKVVLATSTVQRSEGKPITDTWMHELTEKMQAEVDRALKVPIGWMWHKGKYTSPWAQLGKEHWPGKIDLKLEDKPEVACAATGRPALMCPDKITIALDPVIRGKTHRYRNPDGDGIFKVTIANPTDKPLVIPALLCTPAKDGSTVYPGKGPDSKPSPLWHQSLLIFVRDKAFPMSGAATVPAEARPLTLDAGKELSLSVHVLGLQGVTWPNGGRNVNVRFALGDAIAAHTFYYYSDHHDEIRDKLLEQVKKVRDKKKD